MLNHVLEVAFFSSFLWLLTMILLPLQSIQQYLSYGKVSS